MIMLRRSALPVSRGQTRGMDKVWGSNTPAVFSLSLPRFVRQIMKQFLYLFLKRISKYATKGQTGCVAIIVATIFKLYFFFHQLSGTQKAVLEFYVI
jgi:hypothetical protein